MPGGNYRHILLVHPLGYKANAAKRDISRLANTMPPLGLASIAAYLEKRNFLINVIDCYARPDSDDVIQNHVLKNMPGVIGFSCTTSSFHDGIRIASLTKQTLPGIKV